MKRLVCLTLMAAMSLVLSGCCVIHKWEDATCDAPKTCSRCEKTEGEPLSHLWIDADCVNPKTCGFCGAVEGEALGHVCGEWEVLSDEAMGTTCTVCGEAVEQDIDRAVLGTQWIQGEWQMCAGKSGEGDWERISNGLSIKFMENGEFEFRDMKTEHGTYEFDEYDGANGIYWFDCTTEDGAFAIRYDEEDGELYWHTSTSMFYLERV